MPDSSHQFHSLTPTQVFKNLGSQPEGLSPIEVKKKANQYGPNQFTQQDQISKWQILISQFKSFLVFLLFAAAGLAIIVGETFDAIAILFIIVLNALVGFIEEYKAEEALQALKNLETPHAKVKRNNKETTIPAAELVPGDIILLSEGDKVPADARVVESFSLQTNEAALTGESHPVSKYIKKLDEKLPIAERNNLIFSGTVVTKGRGVAVVYATGDYTEFGKIAHLVQETKSTDTPLQKTLEDLGKKLGIISLAVAFPGLVIGLITGRNIIEMIMLSISLAVSAIPEGLPVVVTIALAIGTRRLLKKRVLVRKLPAVEALGSTDVICTDKTGTITMNKMSVKSLVTLKHTIDDIATNTKFKPKECKTSQLIAQCSLLCNDANEKSGDPTEQALLILAEKLGVDSSTRQSFPRLNEIPFSSSQKFMVTLNQVDNKKISFIKGAPEKILDMCSQVHSCKNTNKLGSKDKKYFDQQIAELSSQGMRVLGLAYKEIKNTKSFNKLENFTFLGLVGMIDPARAEVADAIEQCHSAGVRVMMLTGDHPLTARAIATSVGLPDEKAIEGIELDGISRQDMEKLVEEKHVFARVSPEHKLKILRALHNNGHFVAMTGDGVNDAPALKEADIGVAVGDGTDLAKEVSDMILMDNNFAHIVEAIEEARGIFANIKKFVTFLLAANFDEIFVMMSAMILGTPLPMLPIHLLWLNVVTDSLPALSLSVDTYPKDLMKHKPYNPKKEITHGIAKFSLAAGIIAFVATFGVFLREYYVLGSDLQMAQTVTFTVTVLFELWLVFSARSPQGAFKIGIFSNKWLNLAVVASVLLQLMTIYTSIGNTFFKTIALPLSHWPEIILFSTIGFLVIEITRGIKDYYQTTNQL